MYYVYPNKSCKKKIRGKTRKFKQIEYELIESTSEFPEIDLEYGYCHFHIPGNQKFIDSCKTPVSLRRKYIKLILDRVGFLIDNKIESDIPIRVVGCINLPDLWSSQIIVFFGDDYFSNFFDRDSEYEKWIPLSEERDICKEWNLNTSKKIKGYKEEIYDEELLHKGEIWFIGELD